MRAFAGLIVGLVLGFGAAFWTYPWWERGGTTPISKSDKQDMPTSDSFYICSTKFVKDRPLIIKSVNGVAKTVTLDWVQDESVYKIEKTDDLNYTAFARREDGGFYVLALNRVTGELGFADHPSSGAQDLLIDLCANRIPWKECESRMGSIRGGRASECNFVINEHSCPRLNNLGLIREVPFQCTPAERRF